MLFEADYAKNYASILYQCLGSGQFWVEQNVPIFFVETHCLWHKNLQNETILGVTMLVFQTMGPKIAIFDLLSMESMGKRWHACL